MFINYPKKLKLILAFMLSMGSMAFTFGQDYTVSIDFQHAQDYGRSAFLVGDDVIFEIQVTNNTDEIQSNLNIQRTIPTDFLVYKGTTVQPPPLLTFVISEIDPGETATLYGAVMTIIDSGTFTLEAEELESGEKGLQEVIVYDQSDLQILKRVSTDYSGGFVSDEGYAGVNETVFYEISVQNNGPSDATLVRVKDILPEDLTYVSSNPSATYDASTRELVWDLPALTSGSISLITVEVQTTTLGTFINQADVTNMAQFDRDETNNSSSVSLNVEPLYDLSLDKNLIPASVPQEGDVVEFELVLSNDNRSPIDSEITVQDVLPNGYELIDVSALPAGLTYNSATRMLTWVYSDGLGINESTSIQFEVQVAIDNGSLNFVNTASISSDQSLDINETNDSSSAGFVPTENTDVKDLALSLNAVTSYGDLRANVGESVSITLIAENLGDQLIAAGEQILIDLPDGFDLTSFDKVDDVVIDANGDLVYTLEVDLNSGAQALLTMEVTIIDSAESYTLTASHDLFDDRLANNIAVLSIEAIPNADLKIEQSVVNRIDRGGDYVRGDTLDIHIEVSNLGPSTAEAIINIGSNLSTDFDIISFTDGGSQFGNLIFWSLEDPMPMDDLLEFDIVVVVRETGVLNIVSVVESQTTLDTDNTNNSTILSLTATEAVDIEISQSYTPDLDLQTGSVINFEVLVENKGPSPAPGLEISNYLPSGLQLDLTTLSSDASFNTGTIVWTLVDEIPVDGSVTLNFSAEVLGEGLDYNNQVELTASAYKDVDSSPDQRIADHPDALEDDESVLRVNFAPIAVDDVVDAVQAQELQIDVLVNDSFGIDGVGDPDVVVLSEPSFGQVQWLNGFMVYSPNPNYFGSDSFVYQIMDADGDTDDAIVSIEIAEDIDGDGVIGGVDLDSDNDGILNAVEGDQDSDGDGLIDALDIDSDNDGILDLIEAQNLEQFIQPSGVYDATGIDQAFSNGLSPVDSDQDGIADYLDDDSDNDMALDSNESFDEDQNGRGDYSASNIDDNFNGLDDGFEAAMLYQDGFDLSADDIRSYMSDLDVDGLMNFRDSDDDGDGIPTEIEGLEEDCDEDGALDYLDEDNCNLDILTGISPGLADGTNDVFSIEGIENLYPDFEIRIFDRWGSEVYYFDNSQQSGELMSWDGRNKDGEKVETGTYFYIIDYHKDGKKKTKDWIYVKW